MLSKTYTSFIEYHDEVKIVRELSYFRDKVPVMFFAGRLSDVFIARCTPEKIDFIEECMANECRSFDKDKVISNIVSYIILFKVAPTVTLLIDRVSNSVIYDFTNKQVVDYNCFDDLPRQNTLQQIVFWWKSDDESAFVEQLEGGYGLDSAVYVMYYSQQLLYKNVYCSTGIDLIAKLFTDYYGLDAMNAYQTTTSVHPKREKSRYSEAQLTMLDGFCKEYSTKKANSKKETETIPPNNVFIASKNGAIIVGGATNKPLETLSDEENFKDRPVKLSWIKANHRIPVLDNLRYIQNDIAFCPFDIEEIHVFKGILFYTCKTGKMINPSFLSHTFGISVSLIREVFLSGKVM